MKRDLTARITPEHLAAYLEHSLTSAEVAKIYNVKQPYVTRTLPKRPKKERGKAKAELREARNQFRDNLASSVNKKALSIKDMAAIAHCSISTAFRHLRKIRKQNERP